MRKLVTGAIVVLVLAVVVGLISASQSDTSQANTVPGTVCPTDTSNQLAAQSVPTASLVPCVALFGGRWSVTSEDYTDDGTRVSMTGEDAPDVQWKVAFDAACDTSGLSASGNSDGVSVSSSEQQSGSTYERTQAMVFDGGCVTSSVTMPTKFDRGLVLSDVDAALVLVSRLALNDEVREQTDGSLSLDP
jgi:hypothetical protein